MSGYTTHRFNNRSGGSTGAGYNAPKKGGKGLSWPWLLATTALAVVLAAAGMEAQHQYYDYKGRSAFPIAQDAFNKLPEPVKNLSRVTEDAYAKMTRGDLALTRKQDGVTFCVAKDVKEAWNNAAPGSPDMQHSNIAPDFARAIAKRHAQPGASYDEHEVRQDMTIPDSGPWFVYAERAGLEYFRNGGTNPQGAVRFLQRQARGSNLRCGGGYDEYNVTHDGTITPMPQ